jgi:hypothetical protein
MEELFQFVCAHCRETWRRAAEDSVTGVRRGGRPTSPNQ